MPTIKCMPSRRKLSMAVAGAALLVSASTSFADDEKIKFDIDGQQASAALFQLGQSAGIQVLISEEVGSSVNLRGLEGEYTVEQALGMMLQGSGLTHKFTADNVVLITSEEEAQGDDADEEPEEEIVITGTRLKGHKPASPVISLGRDKLEKGGYTSLDDVLRRLPQNLSTQTTASVELEQGEFGSGARISSSLGASAPNLRGLGTRSTLILVNGRRRAISGNGSGSFTDISSIPLSQIERIDILTDGASAVYGADAVAGVINVILRKDYEGVVLQARTEQSSTGGDVNRLTAGYTINWDSGFASLSADFSKTKPSDFNDLIRSAGPQGQGDFRDLGGINTRLVGLAGGNDPRPVYEAFPGFPAGFEADASVQISGPSPFTYSRFEPRVLGPEIETSALRISGEQELSDSLVLSFDASYTQQQDGRVLDARISNLGFLAIASVFDEDFNTAASLRGLTILSETNPNNPNPGQLVAVGYDYAQELSQIQLDESTEQDNINASIGLSGDLAFVDGWDFDVSLSYSKEDGQTDNFGFDPIPGSTAGLTAFVDQVNPFATSDADVAANTALLRRFLRTEQSRFDSDQLTFDANITGTLFSLPAGDAQAAFGIQYRDGEVSNARDFEAEFPEFVPDGLGEVPLSSATEVTSAYAEVALPLFKDLPLMQELTLTLAARYESFDYDGLSQARSAAGRFVPMFDDMGNFIGGSVQGVDVEGVDEAALLGIALPPFTRIREDSFGPVVSQEASFSSTSPQVSLNWEVNDDLRIRSTWGESFLAPQATQLFGFKRNSRLTNSFRFDPDISAALTALGFTSGFEVVGLAGPNSDLTAQEADTFTFGFDYTPGAIEGLSLSATYGKSEYDNFIDTPSSTVDLLQLVNNFEDLEGTLFFRGTNNAFVFDTRQLNLASRISRTVDIGANYQLSTDYGEWLFDLNAVRTLELSNQVSSLVAPTVLSDTQFGPSEWAFDFTTGWSYKNYSVTASMNYSSTFTVVNPRTPSDVENTTFPMLSGNPFFSSVDTPTTSKQYMTVDLQFGYTSPADSGLMSGVRVSLGAQNLLDEEFPFVSNSAGFVANRVNPRGRVLYLDLTKQFDI
ncbi:TonB-dependent receptor [Porticoccus sp. W117]|uniref:TonB-dependent receptor n=1 Tax=Porticoccus sp. W117 TaxID=3054777 RepID=UPI002597C5F5|nr:TonB-dependent receptor [Porticoccus sp. W117]MDM3870968.1 TonB-dependent receptor [Porticoccus sp. W117]